MAPLESNPKNQDRAMRDSIVFLAVSILVHTTTQAELSVPSFFSDQMVVQRERSAMVWGTADPGATVKVAFKGKSATAKADNEGRWKVAVATGTADSKGADLTVTSGDESIVIQDVLVGEVWFASGQSNMVFPMSRVPAYKDIIAESDHPQIRMFNAANVTAVEPQDDIAGEWTLCSPESVPKYSATAFFFARKLHKELDIPIGVIKSAWGGKPVETFTSRDALKTLEGTRKLVDAAVAADENFNAEKANADYEARLEKWKAGTAVWQTKPVEERGRAPKKPQIPKRPLNTEGQPGVLFNSMINPFAGYTMRGAIWYQGEGNARTGHVPYDQTLPLMINDWRNRWNDDFSFYFVQLANFRQPSTEPGNNDPWPLLQDRMRLVLDTTPKTGMAIINDVGEAKDIHPKNKHDVGERLALWALVKDYGKDLTYCGPLFKGSTVKDGAIYVTFNHTGSGLSSRDGENLKRFEIAGEDKVWHWADAEIVAADIVKVSSDDVSDPVAVRYAWAANPEGANLVNSAGLPTSVFRTDDWDDVEQVADAAAQVEERRILAAEIKALAAKKANLKRGSDEFKATLGKQRALMRKFKSLTAGSKN